MRLTLAALLLIASSTVSRAGWINARAPENAIQTALAIHFDLDGLPFPVPSTLTAKVIGGGSLQLAPDLLSKVAEIVPETDTNHPIVLSFGDIDVHSIARPRLVIVESDGSQVAAVAPADLRSLANIQDGANLVSIDDIAQPEEPAPTAAVEMPDSVIYGLLCLGLIACAVLAGRIALRRRVRRPNYAALPSRLMSGRRR